MGDHISGRAEALLAFIIKKYPDAYKEFTEVNPEVNPTVFDTDSPASPDCPKSNPCDMDCSPIGSEAESDTTPSSSDTEEDNDGFKPVLTKSGKRKAAKSLKAPPPNKKPSTPAAAGAAAHAPAGTPVSAPAETAPEENLDRLIKKHFAIESFGVQPRRPTTDAEGKARQILESTTKQLRDGRFETGLLWRNEDEPTPDNLRSTENRLRHIERKLDRDPKLKAEYGRQVQHLLDSGYADEVPEDGGSARRWYLPHFAVTHPTKRRLDRSLTPLRSSTGKV
ncbi:unnamed protein product [Danaus chrysippus]|uniref:(African queen) hypothetical protein n=1 Tax=Danaus chrysippus TaxID=151541 RepID=A0A8J2W7G5_9NEOP|nr:unnamed protein product [Danaus chrysippus]